MENFLTFRHSTSSRELCARAVANFDELHQRAKQNRKRKAKLRAIKSRHIVAISRLVCLIEKMRCGHTDKNLWEAAHSELHRLKSKLDRADNRLNRLMNNR